MRHNGISLGEASAISVTLFKYCQFHFHILTPTADSESASLLRAVTKKFLVICQSKL
jgi:hypothetical protein